MQQFFRWIRNHRSSRDNRSRSRNKAAETTAAATDAPAEDTTASSDKTKEIGSKRTNFRLLPMLLRLFRPFILSIQNNQNHNQRCESHAGSHPAIGGNSGCQIT